MKANKFVNLSAKDVAFWGVRKQHRGYILRIQSMVLLVIIVLNGRGRVKLCKLVVDFNQILFIIGLFFGKSLPLLIHFAIAFHN